MHRIIRAALDTIASCQLGRTRPEGVPYLGIDPRELGQRPRLSVRKKLRDGLDVGFVFPARIRPFIKLGVRVETRVVIVDPRHVGLVELLEDGALRETKHVERGVVASMSVGRTRGDVSAGSW